ncbi:MAG: hypothetical protein K0R84_74 [Clostridia bacterium]|jgi:hypothetical protein|nr:hypothetical protein [Clostridia bacterium]
MKRALHKAIILVLVIAVVFQATVIWKNYRTIYNNNVESYNKVRLDMVMLKDSLKSPEIQDKEKQQTNMSENEIAGIYSKLMGASHQIGYVSGMIIPVNRISKDEKYIIWRLRSILREVLPNQFINNKDITYSDAKRLIDVLEDLQLSMEAETTVGDKTKLALSEAQIEEIMKSLDKLEQYNVKD